MFPTKSLKSNRVCVICGDHAVGYNFDALTCMSCKAFFRRNALRLNKEFKCLFHGQCDITRLTRKFCSSCRLKKCFQQGMKKELILNDEEKRLIREKINLNKIRRQRKISSSSTGSNETTLSNVFVSNDKTDEIKNVDFKSFPKMFNQPSFEFSHPSGLVDGLDLESLVDDPIPQISDSFCEYIINGATPFEDISSNNSNIHNEMVDLDWLDLEFFNNDSDCQPSSTVMQRTSFTNQIVESEEQKPLFDQNSQPQFLDQSNFLTNSIIPFHSGIQQQTTNNESENSLLEKILKLSLNSNEVADQIFGIDLFHIYNYSPRIDYRYLLNEIEDFSSIEKLRMKELIEACSLLENPYRRLMYQNLKKADCNHQCCVSEFFIHRLILMSKRLSSFVELSTKIQAKLLKRSLLEMLCLRSVLLYDMDRSSWCFMDDKCKYSILIDTNIYQSFESGQSNQNSKDVKHFVSMFKNEWKCDNVIFDLMTAIILFTPRSGIIDNEKIRAEHQLYQEILQHYLMIKYPGRNEAQSMFLLLMSRIKAIRYLYEDLVSFFAQVRVVSISPLFNELTRFDSKKFEIDFQTNNWMFQSMNYVDSENVPNFMNPKINDITMLNHHGIYSG